MPKKKRMPKTRVHSTLQSACQISAYAHYARTPVIQLKQRIDDFLMEYVACLLL